MHFYVTLTSNCNLKCKYCYGKSCEDFGSDFHGLAVDYSMPSSIAYDTETLGAFLQKDQDPTVVFYGGEPLLRMDKIREIMNEVETGRFMIQTDANITPCPVMAGMKDFYLGDIRETDPETLKDSMFVSEPCTNCEIYPICGGRCLYANTTKLWGDEGFSQVCGTVRNMVDALHEALPQVERLIEKGAIRLEDFEYTKYNSCEVIP